MKPLIVGIIAFTLLIIGGSVVLLGKAPKKAVIAMDSGAKIEIDHPQYDFGTIKLNSGILKHRYPIKSIGQTDLKIINLFSSCACTKVYFKSATQESPKAGMKGMTKPTDWIGILKPGETGEIIIEFDPNFHRIQGIGKISRSLSFETNDPDHGYLEFDLNGQVTR